ncbi:MAG: hypothetical protein OXG72_16670 [Acidobacteria bacterium]|nr:hypothetical protein [Acidobacteriota bacterium]
MSGDINRWIVGSESEKDVSAPFDETLTVRIRPLSWFELDEARNKRTRSGMRILGEPTELLKAQHEISTISPGAERLERSPEMQRSFARGDFDPTEVLKHGIVAWPFDQPLKVSSIRQLVPRVAEWLFSEIMFISLPPDDLGNESGESSGPTTGTDPEPPSHPSS